MVGSYRISATELDFPFALTNVAEKAVWKLIHLGSGSCSFRLSPLHHALDNINVSTWIAPKLLEQRSWNSEANCSKGDSGHVLLSGLLLCHALPRMFCTKLPRILAFFSASYSPRGKVQTLLYIQNSIRSCLAMTRRNSPSHLLLCWRCHWREKKN